MHTQLLTSLLAQLEAIHMQSPFTAAQNPTSPYGAMAQMFLTSPPDHTQLPEPAQSGQFFDSRGHRKISASHVLAGVLTPGVYRLEQSVNLKPIADGTQAPVERWLQRCAWTS